MSSPSQKTLWGRTDVPSLPWQTNDFRNPIKSRPRIVAEFDRLVQDGAHPHYAWLAAQEAAETDEEVLDRVG
jgi:hypothetical protein